MPLFLFCFLALLFLLLVSGGCVFYIGCVRKKEIRWLIEDEVKQTPYKIYYDHILAADRWISAHSKQDLYIESADGLRLHGLWIPAENPKGTILLAHGYRSTYLVDFGLAFPFYHDFGLNILVPDQRSHGSSEGRFITFGIKESDDMRRWVEYHNRVFGPLPMVLSGLSMGASTVMYLADAALPVNVRGIIADCGFTSPWDILGSVYRRVIHLPPALSLWSAELFARIFASFSLRQKDTRKSLAGNRLPILMIHGTADGFVPCSMTVAGYDSCVGDKQLLLVNGADHGVSFLVDRERYTELVTQFLNKNVVDNV